MRNKDLTPRQAAPTVKPKFCQHLRADNDTNGNPRRLYVVYDERGNVLQVIDEGYRGLPKELHDIDHLPDVEISGKTYREWLREFNSTED